MPETSDLAFAKAVVAGGVVSRETGGRLLQIHSVLRQHSIAKNLADVAVETGWVEKDKADEIIGSLNAGAPDSHPPLNVAFSSPAIESAAQRAASTGTIPREKKQEVEKLAASLEGFGYRRTFGELCYDLGLVKGRPATEDDRPRVAPGAEAATRATAAKSPTRQGTAVRTKTEVKSPTRQGTAVRTKTEVKAPTRQGTAVRTKPGAAAEAPARPGTRSAARPATRGRATTQHGTLPGGTGGGNKNRKVLLIASAGGLAAILLVAVAMGMGNSGSGPKPEDTNNTAKTSPKPPPVKPPPTPTPSLPVTPDPTPSPSSTANAKLEGECDSYLNQAWQHKNAGNFKMSMECLRTILDKYTATKYYQENRTEVETLLAEVQKKIDEEAAPTTSPDASPDPDAPMVDRPPTELAPFKKAWEEKRAARVTEGKKRYEEARNAVEADRVAEEKRLADQLTRLGGKKLDIGLKSGLKLQNAVVRKLTRDGVKLTCEFEGTEVEMDFGWDLIDDRSYLVMQRAIHGTDNAAALYEVGRSCIVRKLWKDAKATFDACVKLDGSYASRVPDLTKILNKEGAFKGKSSRVGKDRLMISYDFMDAEQGEDWDARGSGQMEIEGGVAKLVPAGMTFRIEGNKVIVMTGGGTALWTLKDVDFENDLSIDLKATIDDKAVLILGCLFNWENKGYQLKLGSSGTQLFRYDGGNPPNDPSQKDERKVTGEVDLRLSVKEGKFAVSCNGAEVFSGEDTTHTKGWFMIGATGAPVLLKKLLVTGKVNPTEIDKRFAEAEILIRRALEGDLSATATSSADGGSDDDLSLEDEYFKKQLSDELLDEFEDGRKKISAFRKNGSMSQKDYESAVESLNKVVNEAKPPFPAAYYWRGVLWMATGKREEALRDLSIAAKHPDFFEARVAIAQFRFREMKYDEAVQLCDEALKVAPDFVEAMGIKASIKFLKGTDPKVWKGEFETALKLNPGDEGVRSQYREMVNEFKGPEHLGCKFKRETAHFIVMTDISMERTKLYGERLEAAFAYYADTFKAFFTDKPGRPKPRVAIFNTREAYFTYAELTSSDRKENTLGYFTPMYNELLLFEEVDVDETLHTLYHEAFHQFMSMMVPTHIVPYWYNEGIAEYMGSIKVEKGKIVAKGQLLEGRLKGLKMQINRLEHKFEDIMKQSPGQFYSGPASFKYAQVWTMIHFFYEHQGGKHRHLIDAYYKALLDGKDINGAFDEVFAKVDLDALQKEWRAYVDKMQLPKKETPKK